MTASTAELTSQAGLKWQLFTIQPMHNEINRVMHHYLAFNAPRELNLSHRDRALCLHALQHTTHPSTLLPAVNITEAALRGQSHPNFIRWSICNGNKRRVFFVRSMDVSNIAFGFIIAILLTLWRASRWWRIFAAIEWFVGISTMVAAYKGLCVILHKGHYRTLRLENKMLVLKLEIPEGTLTPVRQIVRCKWPPELEIMGVWTRAMLEASDLVVWKPLGRRTALILQAGLRNIDRNRCFARPSTRLLGYTMRL